MKNSFLLQSCVLLLEVVAILSMIAPVLGWLGKVCWFFDLFSHFRLQYIAYFLLLCVFFLLLKRKTSSTLCGVMVFLLALPLGGFFLPGAKADVSHPLKVISYNVNLTNRSFEAVRDFLSKEDADVVFLMEVNGSWCRAMQDLREMYPYQILKEREDFYGVALFSKHPFVKQEVHIPDFNGAAMLEVEIEEKGTTYHFFAAHAACPMTSVYTQERNGELLAIARSIKESHASNVIVMGDFNMTPFSPYFSDILNLSGLKNSMMGFGIAPSWMSDTLVAIPIDHLLLSPNLQVTRRALGDTYGSDHNPLIVELGTTPAKL